MSVNPLKADLNRAKQIKSTKGDLKQSITLFDIDYAMMTYLEDLSSVLSLLLLLCVDKSNE